jgi:hypothetical protein
MRAARTHVVAASLGRETANARRSLAPPTTALWQHHALEGDTATINEGFCAGAPPEGGVCGAGAKMAAGKYEGRRSIWDRHWRALQPAQVVMEQKPAAPFSACAASSSSPLDPLSGNQISEPYPNWRPPLK